MKRIVFLLISILVLPIILVGSAKAEIIYATEVLQIARGGAVVDGFPGYYGGSYPGGSFPVTLDEATAKSYVLGAPNTNFLSLPGDGMPPADAGFPWAFVKVGFSTTFGADQLIITEVADNDESAYIWLWRVGGGNVQFVIPPRGASDNIVVDLSPYAAFGPFEAVTVGGLDLLGDSKGFDLDAVGVRVPEPGTMLLLGAALLGILGMRRKL